MSRTFVKILRTIALAVGALFILLRGPAAQCQVRDVISFDGDNRAQLLIRSGTAATQLGRFDTATQRFNFFAAADPGTSFRYVAAVDLNGDGRSDLVYQNITQGQAGDVAALDGIKPNTSTVLRSVKRTWDVQAVGDLDGDGFGDLVWRYVVSGSPDTGVSYVWFTNGSSVTQVRKRGGAPLDWKLIGARDINGDHAADMVYVSPDNRIRVLMAAAQRTCANLQAGSVSPGFTAVRLADFEGTGRASLLTRSADGAQLELISLDGRGVPLPPPSTNPDDPNAACASSNSSIITSKTRLPTVNPTWQLVGADDYDGDGIADLVWMQPDGSLTFWKMNGTASPRVSANVGTIPAGFESYANAIAAVPSSYPVGISDQTMMVDGTNRNYRVYVPNSITAMRAIVLVLHGGGGEGLGVADIGSHPLSVFRTVADREGFVVVYPGGLPAMDGNPGWDDCRSDNRMASGADDIGFLDALIAQLRAEYGLSASRVFLSGGSNGAQMVLGYAIARAENFEAIAVGNGNLPLNPKPGACSAPPARRFPVLMTHGTADVPMPYGGGCVANLGGACNRGRVVSAEATRDRWLQANGLAAVTPSLTTVNVDPADAGPANRFHYAGTEPVEWWRLDGAGHPAPSRTVLAGNAVSGPQNRDVEFAELAWSFFAARLPASAPPAVSGSGAYTITRSIGTAALSVPAIVDKPVGDSLDVMLLFHGTVGVDSLVLDAARNTLDAFGALFNRRDLLLVSVAYPEEGLLMGDNVRHAEAALQWVRDSAARELGINVRRVFLAGHSQGGYIVTRLNTQYTVDGVIASAPGPLDLVYRCGLEEDGRLAASAVCSLLRQTYGSTSAASQSYRARSLLEFTGNQRSPLLVIQGQADSPIQMANWPLFRQQLEACATCAARTILELPGLGHPALFTSAEAKRTFNEFLGPLRRVN